MFDCHIIVTVYRTCIVTVTLTTRAIETENGSRHLLHGVHGQDFCNGGFELFKDNVTLP